MMWMQRRVTFNNYPMEFKQSLSDYKRQYPDLLKSFLAMNEGATKLDFARQQIRAFEERMNYNDDYLPYHDMRLGTPSVYNSSISYHGAGKDTIYYLCRSKLEYLIEKENEITGYAQPTRAKKIKVKKKKLLPEQVAESKEIDKQEAKIEEDGKYTYKSIIEAELEIVKEKMQELHYNILVNALNDYFTKGQFPKVVPKIKVSRVAVKKFGWALHEIYVRCKDDNSTFSFEYLLFAQANISIFKKYKMDKANYQKSLLYSYFHTKP